MRWRRGERSSDIEDRRGQSIGGGFRAGPKLGIGGILTLLALSLIFGQDFFAIFQGGDSLPSGGDPGGIQIPYRPSAKEEELVDFVSFVLDDVQSTWDREFPSTGRQYNHAKLVLFTDAVRSACGFAQAAMGPFYCPEDQKVYIDLGFYRELKDRFGAPGDFAQAYVIAHEVGHHVQNLLGIVNRMRHAQGTRPGKAGALSIRMELQADCLAGVWANSTGRRDLLERGDVEEGLEAAAAVGDDRIQKQGAGYVNPETWTHGSSRQRAAWFKRGFASGRVQDCDTFNVALPGIDDPNVSYRR
jgi:predicted metalloprotease